MARMTSSAALLPVYALDLVRRHWVTLLCVYTVGMLAHTLLMRGLVAFTDTNPTLALAGLGLTLLITLVTFVDIPELSAGVAAAIAAAWSSLKEGFLAPMLWLTITAVAYRAQITDHDALFDQRRGGGQLGAAVNRAAKLGKVFGRYASSDFRDRISPCLNAVRFVLGAGPVFYLSFCLYFVLLDVLFSQLNRGVFVLLGPGDFQGQLWPWLQPVEFAVDALHTLFRLCLLAAAFEIALRRAERTSLGRRVWRAAGHASR